MCVKDYMCVIDVCRFGQFSTVFDKKYKECF